MFCDHVIPPYKKAQLSTIVNGLKSTWLLLPSTPLANFRMLVEQKARDHGYVQVDESVLLMLANRDGTLETIDGYGNATIGSVITSMGDKQLVSMVANSTQPPASGILNRNNNSNNYEVDAIQPVIINFVTPGVADGARPGPSNIKRTSKSQFVPSKFPKSRPSATTSAKNAGEDKSPRNPKPRADREAVQDAEATVRRNPKPRADPEAVQDAEATVRKNPKPRADPEAVQDAEATVRRNPKPRADPEAVQHAEAAVPLAKSKHHRKVGNVHPPRVANVNAQRVGNVNAQRVGNVNAQRVANVDVQPATNVHFQPHANRHVSEAPSIHGGEVPKQPDAQADTVLPKRNRKRPTPSSGVFDFQLRPERHVPQRVRLSDTGAPHQLEARHYYAKAAVPLPRSQHHREIANVEQHPLANVRTKQVAYANAEIAEGGPPVTDIPEVNHDESDPASSSDWSASDWSASEVPSSDTSVGHAHSVRLHRRSKQRRYWSRLRPGRGPERVTLSDLAKMHELTAREAAEKLDIGISQLQVVRKKLGLKRWPSQKARITLKERAFVRSTRRQRAVEQQESYSEDEDMENNHMRAPLMIPRENSVSSESDSEADIPVFIDSEQGPIMSVRQWNRLYNRNAGR